MSTVTFKADGELLEALNKIPNKSEFIRAAILNALDDSCPLCGGTGFLNAKQREHWEEFKKFHKVGHCRKCDSLQIECCGSKGEVCHEHKKEPQK